MGIVPLACQTSQDSKNWGVAAMFVYMSRTLCPLCDFETLRPANPVTNDDYVCTHCAVQLVLEIDEDDHKYWVRKGDRRRRVTPRPGEECCICFKSGGVIAASPALRALNITGTYAHVRCIEIEKRHADFFHKGRKARK